MKWWKEYKRRKSCPHNGGFYEAVHDYGWIQYACKLCGKMWFTKGPL